MSEINFTDMQKMQLELHREHKSWGMPRAEITQESILYIVEEIGEMIAITKKKGVQAILDDEIVRENFKAEMVDVLMYVTKVMLCLDISPEEISTAFIKKHNYNMKRNWDKQNEKLYSEKSM